MITPHIKAQNEAALAIIDNSTMSQDEKERWHVLLKTAMENCNGLTQKEKIEGIAQLLFDQTIILLNRRIREDQLDAMRIHDEESIKIIADQADNIAKVQETQQGLIDSIKDNMQKISELSQNIILINDRMTSLENKDIVERQAMEERIKTLFNNMQQDLTGLREDNQKNIELFVEKLENYTVKLSDYDKQQDKKIQDNFDKLSNEQREDKKAINDTLANINDTVTEIKTTVNKDPESWKGVVTRLFTPRTTIILLIVLLIMLALKPDFLTTILTHLH